MRINSKTLAIGGVLTLITLGGSSSVSAESTCAIGYTGPDSSNMCTSVEKFECTVTNNNEVTVVGQNAQGSVSGNAGGSAGGNVAQTGTASNSNGATFNIEVTNAGVCTAVRTIPATNTTPPPSTGGGAGAGAGAVAAPSRQVAPSNTSLPTQLANTGGNVEAWLPFVLLAAAAVSSLLVRYLVTVSK